MDQETNEHDVLFYEIVRLYEADDIQGIVTLLTPLLEPNFNVGLAFTALIALKPVRHEHPDLMELYEKLRAERKTKKT